MDVDLPSSSLKRSADIPLTSSSANKRNKTLLPDEQLAKLSSSMDRMKNRRIWRIWAKEAADDHSRWPDLISDVMLHLAMELASTNMKDSVTTNLTTSHAEAIVKNFNDVELEGWKVGVLNGLDKDDWIDLLVLLPKLDEQPKPAEEESLTPSTSENFTPAQHRIKDEAVIKVTSGMFKGPELSELECAVLLTFVVSESDGKLQQAFADNKKAFKLMCDNRKLVLAMREAWRTQNYQKIRDSALLTKPNLSKDEPIAQRKATENAWITAYRGQAPAALWAQITKAMLQTNRYARYLAIVQSSGTGKSRMIDELGKKHLVIPVNLRDPHETGYPPPDKQARRYICWAADQMDARTRAVAFLIAVINETVKVINTLQTGDMKYDQIVDSFSHHMSEGMNFESHGENRRSFYDGVVARAIQLEEEIAKALVIEKDVDDQLASAGICEAFQILSETLNSRSPKSITAATRRTEPLVILAFDEARALTMTMSHSDGWSCFSELRRALRALNEEPLFTLFLTTTGNVDALFPSSSKDLSNRIRSKDLFASHPFAEVGFDHFAIKNQFNLQKVTLDEHLSHFGRPLWATRYDEGSESVKNDIVRFAANKLRAGTSHLDQLDEAEKLACLAQRLPIEFHSVTYASKVDELKLVEGHMRILLRLDPGFESLTTVSASEPLLSEAAYMMMCPDETFKAAETLMSCLAGYAIHKGDRGELLVMLLFIMARDLAVGQPGRDGRPLVSRWCLVPCFMKSLFRSPAPLQPFADSKIFFNHWVKIHQHAIVNVKYLAQLMRRGAAVLCGTNQAGIDGIIPFLVEGDTISAKNIGAIVFQVKNDAKFQDKPNPKLFKAMDPYALGILNREAVIRIVFALASKIPCLETVRCEEDFVSHDFWVAGISPKVFLPVQSHDEAIWAALLQATYGWEDMYKTHSDTTVTRRLRRSMNPGAASNQYHWDNWADFTAMNNIEEDEGL